MDQGPPEPTDPGRPMSAERRDAPRGLLLTAFATLAALAVVLAFLSRDGRSSGLATTAERSSSPAPRSVEASTTATTRSTTDDRPKPSGPSSTLDLDPGPSAPTTALGDSTESTSSSGPNSSTTTTAPSTTTESTTTTVATTVIGPNLVINGSFAQPALATHFVIAAAPGWSSTGAGDALEIWSPGHSGVTAPNGGQLAELNARAPETYAQTIAVEAGRTYRWSFHHRGRSDTDTVEFSIDGTVIDRFSTGTSWSFYRGEYRAPSDWVELSFRAVDSGASGNLLTDVEFRQIISG